MVDTWEGYWESRTCSDTYPEPYITKYSSIRRLEQWLQRHAEAGPSWPSWPRVSHMVRVDSRLRWPSQYKVQGCITYKKTHPLTTLP